MTFYELMRDEIPRWMRNWRVFQLGTIALLGWILAEFSLYIMQTPYGELTQWQLGPIATVLPALVAGMFAFLKTLAERKYDNISKTDT